MPKAVAVLQAERFDLKTVPEGFVALRKLTYGEILKRRTLSGMMEMSDVDNQKGLITMNAEAVGFYEFKTAVVDHNLEDENGRQLNFNDPQDVVKLDPRVAQEIERHINDMNNLSDSAQKEEQEQMVPLPSKSGNSSVQKVDGSK